MNSKKMLGAVSAGLFVGFVAGIIASPSIPFSAFGKDKKKMEEAPIVRELKGIEGAISDRNSPVVKELEDISAELEEIAEMKREIKKIEGHLDD